MQLRFFFVLFLFLSSFAYADCLSQTQLTQLATKETNYLLNKVPPAFAHALEDGAIKVSVTPEKSTACGATLSVTLPENDLKDAQQILDAQPAKKIMLAAQGQGLPSTTQEAASFQVDPDTLAVAHDDVLQTAPLGKLRASIELMYALLTQARANVKPNQTNNIAWSTADKAQVSQACQKKHASQICTCMANVYASKISPRQMDYIDYIRANPYALATGANQGFESVKKIAEAACKG